MPSVMIFFYDIGGGALNEYMAIITTLNIPVAGL